jgi:hypothetical protein
VRGLKHSTTSKTETWIVTFKEEIAKEINIQRAFMKISIDYESYSKFENSEIHSYLGTYKTENTIYKYINSLVDKKICNNFVKLITVKEDVSLKDMVAIISEKMVNGKRLGIKNAVNNFKRNIMDSISENSERKEIGSTCKIPVKFNARRNWRYQYVMTEALTNDDSIMSDYMSTLLSHRVPFTLNTWNIIFQVAHACYIMEKFKISHNDLHTGNIWLRLQKKQEEYTYIVNDKVYTFTPKYVALIYDYDRGYMEEGGKRVKNTVTYKEFEQTNRVVCGRDFTRFIYIVYSYFAHDVTNRRVILDCICKSEESKERIIKFSLNKEINYDMLKKSFLEENILPLEEILHNFSVICKTVDTVTSEKENIYSFKNQV